MPDRLTGRCLLPIARRLHRHDIMRFCGFTYSLGLLGGLRERMGSRA